MSLSKHQNSIQCLDKLYGYKMSWQMDYLKKDDQFVTDG